MHWIALYANGNNVTCFDSFDVERIPEATKGFTDNKNNKKYLQNTGLWPNTMWIRLLLHWIYRFYV